MKQILIILIYFLSIETLTAQSFVQLLREARELEQEAKEEEALAKFLEVLEISPNNHESLWNVSFLYSRIGNRQTDHDNQVKYFYNAKEYAERALRINPRHEQSNYVMAVALGRMALISGARERVAASRDIKKFADLTLEANPNHAGAHHVLGLWNYRIANLSWSERSAARLLFGGVPGDASNEQSIASFKKAIELDPEMILYLYDLAETHKKLGQNANAKAVLEQMLQRPVKTADDPQLLKDGRELMKSL